MTFQNPEPTFLVHFRSLLVIWAHQPEAWYKMIWALDRSWFIAISDFLIFAGLEKFNQMEGGWRRDALKRGMRWSGILRHWFCLGFEIEMAPRFSKLWCWKTDTVRNCAPWSDPQILWTVSLQKTKTQVKVCWPNPPAKIRDKACPTHKYLL